MKLKLSLFMLVMCVQKYIISATFIVSSNLNITGPSTLVYDGILVTNNSTLNIRNCALLIKYNKDIVVEPGSKLILDNVYVSVENSGNIPNFWKGISIKGNFNLTQTESNQGTLILKNQTIIEKALVGISVGKLKYVDHSNSGTLNLNWHLDGGGIIKSENSTIKNCFYGVVFSPYFNSQMQRPYANISYFKNTVFMWDKNANFSLCFANQRRFKSLVELNYVHDIRFIGCTFTNTMNYATEWYKDLTNTIPDGINFRDDYLSRGEGIFSYGSSFYLHSNTPCSEINAGSNCKECNGKQNKFEYLSIAINLQSHRKGVQAFSSLPSGNLETHVDITNCYFHNNHLGIHSNISDYTDELVISIFDLYKYKLENVFINRNVFLTDNRYYNYFYMNHAQDVFLNYTGNAEISNNTFIHKCMKKDTFQPSNHMLFCRGGYIGMVRIENSIDLPVKIHKNYFNDMDGSDEPCDKFIHCVYSLGVNNNLSISCNDFNVDKFNYYDISGYWTDPHSDVGIVNGLEKTNRINNSISDLGTSLISNGNKWSDTGTYNFQTNPIYPAMYRKTNNISVYNVVDESKLEVAPQINCFYYGDDYPKYVRIQDHIMMVNYSSSPAQSLIHVASSSPNQCLESSFCNYYTPFEANPNGNPIVEGGINNPNETTIPLLASLNVSPNPSSEPFIGVSLIPNDNLQTFNGQLIVKDQNGNVVLVKPINTMLGVVIDTSSWLPGIYYFTYVDSSGKTITIIFIKY